MKAGDIIDSIILELAAGKEVEDKYTFLGIVLYHAVCDAAEIIRDGLTEGTNNMPGIAESIIMAADKICDISMAPYLPGSEPGANIENGLMAIAEVIDRKEI